MATKRGRNSSKQQYDKRNINNQKKKKKKDGRIDTWKEGELEKCRKEYQGGKQTRLSKNGKKEDSKKKRKAFKLWQADRTEERKEAYREKTRQARRAVAVAKEAAWQEWCREIDSAEGRQKIFKIAKQMRREKILLEE